MVRISNLGIISNRLLELNPSPEGFSVLVMELTCAPCHNVSCDDVARLIMAHDPLAALAKIECLLDYSDIQHLLEWEGPCYATIWH